jgi:DNA-binding response OmpR family regulator
MPGTGGVETCQRIRTLAPEIGIVMVTVRDDVEDKVRALEAVADDSVTKPFRFRELVAFLMKNQGAPLTHTRLLRAVWGPEYRGELEHLRSEPWVGYRFRNPSDPDAPTPPLDDEWPEP